MMFFGILFFFITFFRLSFINANLYLAIIPAFLGILLLFSKINKLNSLRINKKYFSVFSLFVILFLYTAVLDGLQLGLTLSSSFFFRILSIILFSFFPAYYICSRIIGEDKSKLEKIVFISFLIQLGFYIITYISPSTKILIYSLLGASESSNLEDWNLTVRGFGLSGEINFMTPSLMVLISFLMFRGKTLFKLVTFILQVLNSNMTVIFGALGILFDRGKLYLKIISMALLYLVYQVIGKSLIEEYFPRFYAEYIESGGERTANGLLSNHVFLAGDINFFNILFGFQKNVSSTIESNTKFSDIGWIIIFNYGGIILTILVALLIVSISFATFKNRALIFLWIIVGILLNTKGLIIGLNGYFFITFTFMLTRYFDNKAMNKDV